MQPQPNAFPTTSLLTPDQVSAATEEIKSLDAKLSNPLIQDKGQVRKQLQQAKKLFDQQAPRAPETSEEEGRMVRRSRELLNEILQGMPSQEEMRKAPAGAVDKHMRWERRNKPKIMEWKHIQRRLTAGSNERDAANLERFRPTSSTLNMDSAQIPGKQFFMPATSGPVVTFSNEQLEYLKSIGFEPALLSNDQRAMVKEAMNGIGLAEPSKASQDGKRGVEKREAKKRGRPAKVATQPQE